ncbi:MAG TPA: NAD-dependent epimerase/dehydratase family protein, partial [Saprospiraceae bacterium]|nr:NAD-dependent epimerase/dehydratase family protein [Saprospiraceae bacterium]
EGAACQPLTDYGKSKLQAEQELLKLSDDQFVVSIIRPAVVYGKGAKGNIAKLMKLIDKLPVIPLGDISNRRSMVYVGNFLALLKSVIDNAMPGVFIAADNEAKSTSDMVKEINRLRPTQKKIISMPKLVMKGLKGLLPDMHSKLFGDFEVDNTLTNERLNFTPPYTFETGMREMMGMEESTQNKRTDVSL